MVSVLAFYSNDPSSNLVAAYISFVKFVLEMTKKQKGDSGWPISLNMTIKAFSVLAKRFYSSIGPWNWTFLLAKAKLSSPSIFFSMHLEIGVKIAR